MADKAITIEAQIREKTGKEYARLIRKQGKIPGNIIGKGQSTLIELDPKWLGRAYSQDKTFDLLLEGQTKKVRIQEVAIHPTKRTAVHVDLMYV